MLTPRQSPSNVEDDVEEYHFTEADYPKSDEFDSGDFEGDPASDRKSIISLSSDISEGGPSSLPLRPWKDFTREERIAWETMYTQITEYPMGGSWEITEDYQRAKDTEMMNYLQDFPLDTWVIPREQSQGAWFRLHERNRRRSLGMLVFVGENMPAFSTSSGSIVFSPHASAHLAPAQTSGNFYRTRGPNHDHRTVFELDSPAKRQARSISNIETYDPLRPRSQSLGSHGVAHVTRNTTTTNVSYPRHSTHYELHGSLQGLSRIASQASHQRTIPRTIRPMVSGFAQDANGSSLSKQLPTANEKIEPPQQPTLANGRVSSATPTSSIRASTPPYPTRPRPGERFLVHKKIRRNLTKLMHLEEYPWCREIDFKQVRATATWDDTCYDRNMLQAMDTIRAHNSAIIAELDSGTGEKSHSIRGSRKSQAEMRDDLSSSSPAIASRNTSGKKLPVSGGDPYHSGDFAFATTDDEQRALALGTATPEDLMEAVEAGTVKLESVMCVKIFWCPGKRAPISDLRQVVFSVGDTVLTRKQLQHTPVLTTRAAECIIDFCPDMLWRSMLLRILSEAGFGNKAASFALQSCFFPPS